MKGYNQINLLNGYSKIATEIKNLSHLEQIKYFKQNIDESDLKIWWNSLNN